MSSINTAKPVLGYVLQECIGRGGYGEVWKAEAPGGILKALKIVHGYHDEDRALNELKALNRIKGLRHPFLLGLERIEVLDGRLIIVTELAEMSLKDRFERCREENNKGVKRDELLRYIRDAADALDYISETHSLQHLDIKPENLLLIGGHVKIGDFGLVKEIQDIEQSFLGGLTPIYAPPEIFDGSPSLRSDQYSLAIVYQEMLTGHRPFPGSTAAQLAAQHVNGKPNLDSLSRGDKKVVGRALSKAPENRYASCKEFVEDLFNRSVRRSEDRARPAVTRSTSKPIQSKTSHLSETIHSTVYDNHLTRLPKLPFKPTDKILRPTIFLGVGRTASLVLRQLKRRVCGCSGSIEDLPSIKFLCLDTDISDLNKATRDASIDFLSYDEILPMPLRAPKEYRNDASLHLSWLSRRWIYNIPRSLKTEGIRPLGRLAFADHHQRLFDKLHDITESAILPESKAETAESIGFDFSDAPPQVFIVASISGGVGSGMVLDLAYAIRTVLIEQGAGDAEITGVFPFSSGGTAAHKDITVANTFACLTEIYHYTSKAEFPGDPTCKLPAFEDNRPPFSNLYLMDMGGEMLQDEFDQSIASMSEYLYLNSASRCAPFFCAARKSPDDSKELEFGSFGLSHPATISNEIAAAPIAAVSQQLTHLWMGKTKSSTTPFDAASLLEQLFQEYGLNIEKILSGIINAAETKIGCPPPSALHELVQEFTGTSDHDLSTLVNRLEHSVDRMLASGSTSQKGGFDSALKYALDEHLVQITDQMSELFTTQILSILDRPGGRLCGAQLTANYFGRKLVNQINDLRHMRQEAEELNRDAARRILNLMHWLEPICPDVLAQAVVDFAKSKMDSFFLRYAEKTIRSIKTLISNKLSEKLESFGELLASLDKEFGIDVQDANERPNAIASQPKEITSLIVKQIMSRCPELVQKSDFRLQQGDLAELLSDEFNSSDLARLKLLMVQRTEATISDALKEIDFDKIIRDSGFDGIQIAEWLKEHLQMAMPMLLNKCGGASRLLLAIPEHSRPGIVSDCLEKQFEYSPTVVPATHGNLTICFEGQQIPLKNVLIRLIKERPDCVEYASRLHTRNDVDWTPVTDIVK